MGPLFDSRKMESNEPSLKRTNFSKLSIQFQSNAAETQEISLKFQRHSFVHNSPILQFNCMGLRVDLKCRVGVVDWDGIGLKKTPIASQETSAVFPFQSISIGPLTRSFKSAMKCSTCVDNRAAFHSRILPCFQGLLSTVSMNLQKGSPKVTWNFEGTTGNVARLCHTFL